MSFSSADPMPYKLQTISSASEVSRSSLNAPVDRLIQCINEPSAMRSYLASSPGSILVDELEELLQRLPVSQPGNKMHKPKEWSCVSQRIYSEVVLPWSPRILSLQELHQHRQDTKRRLAVIYLLEEVEERQSPLLRTPVTDMITLARLDHSARFGRLFRINELPVETMSIIFHYVVWSAKDPQECNRRRLVLSATCGLWRRVVVMDSTLWNTFYYQVESPGQISFSKLMIDRCGLAPMDIYLRDCPERPLGQEMMEDILNHLASRRSQLRTLSVAVQQKEAGLTLLHWLQAIGLEKQSCNLKRLVIHRLGPPYIQMDSDYPPNFYGPLPLFGGALVSSLRHLSISGLHVDWTRTTLENLTTLDIRRIPINSAPDVDRFCDILSNCPKLSHLVLHGAGPKWSPHDNFHLPVTLPDLKSLILADFALNYVQFVLNSFFAPGLEELELHGFTGEDYTTLFERLTGLFPKIRSLALVLIDLSPEERGTRALARMFVSMPDVRFLQVSKISDSFWDVFHLNPQTLFEYPDFSDGNCALDPSHILFPHLNCLDVNDTSWNSLYKFLAFRRQIGYGLDRVYIAHVNWLELDAQERDTLQQLAATLFTHNHPSKINNEESLE